MTKTITIPLCIIILGLASCERINNEFIVHDPEDVMSSAELQLCGSRLQLTKIDNEFKVTMPITCEGEGNILIHLLTGDEINCRIGYVTPGAKQTFEYTIKNWQCS